MDFSCIFLIHLGTPKDFSANAAEIFLREFLSDKEVLPLPFFLREFLAAKIAKKRAKAYSEKLLEFSVDGEMQLSHYAKGLAQKLQKKLGADVFECGAYGANNIENAFSKLSDGQKKNMLFIPLYPQCSSATTFPIIKKIKKLKLKKFTLAENYFENEKYIDALSKMLNEKYKDSERLILSFHSLPHSFLKRYDYKIECERTLELLRKKNPQIKMDLAWQSEIKGRMGRWLSPRTEEKMEELLAKGVKNIAVICPGFFCENLETSFDMEIKLKEKFFALGGNNFNYIPCLNDGDLGVAVLEEIFYKGS